MQINSIACCLCDIARMIFVYDFNQLTNSIIIVFDDLNQSIIAYIITDSFEAVLFNEFINKSIIVKLSRNNLFEIKIKC